MTAELSFVTATLQILAGVVLAAGALYAIKGYSQKIRLVLTSAALLVAVLVYVLLALFSGNPVFVAIEIIGLMLFLFHSSMVKGIAKRLSMRPGYVIILV